MGIFGSKKEAIPQAQESQEEKDRAALVLVEMQKKELVTGNMGEGHWGIKDRNDLERYNTQIAELKEKLGIEEDEEKEKAA